MYRLLVLAMESPLHFIWDPINVPLCHTRWPPSSDLSPYWPLDGVAWDCSILCTGHRVSLSLGQRWWYNRRFLSAIYCYSPVNLHTRALGHLPSLARMLTGNLRVNKRRLSTYTAPVEFYSVLNDVTNVFRCFIPLEDNLGQVSSGSSGQQDQINWGELNHLRDCNLIWFCDGRWNGPRKEVRLEIKLQAEV